MVQEGDKSNYGKWNIPSGGVDANEPIAAAAARRCLRKPGVL
jgi:ADP-ribose pyrophosphatase YjhB (NUDIX family)